MLDPQLLTTNDPVAYVKEELEAITESYRQGDPTAVYAECGLLYDILEIISRYAVDMNEVIDIAETALEYVHEGN